MTRNTRKLLGLTAIALFAALGVGMLVSNTASADPDGIVLKRASLPTTAQVLQDGPVRKDDASHPLGGDPRTWKKTLSSSSDSDK